MPNYDEQLKQQQQQQQQQQQKVRLSHISSGSLDHITSYNTSSNSNISHKYNYVNKASSSSVNCRASHTTVVSGRNSKRSLSIADLTSLATGVGPPMQTNTRIDDNDEHDYPSRVAIEAADDDDTTLFVGQKEKTERVATKTLSLTTTTTTEAPKLNRKNNHHLATCRKKENSKQEKECDFTNSNNSCSRRSTLASLIKLFEQKVQVHNAIITSVTATEAKNEGDEQTEAAAAESRNIATTSNKKQQSTISSCRLISCKANKINKLSKQVKVEAAKPVAKAATATSRSRSRSRNRSETNMRDIITPVSYDHEATESSESSKGNNTTEEEDSLEEVELFSNPSSSAGVENEAESDSPSDKLAAQNRHRICVKGVQVLPASSRGCSKKPSLQKLTKTNWQPPTDARKYDRLLTPTVSTKNSSSISSKQRKSLLNPANFSPSIVRHQPSSSRRLLDQLARVRKQTKPSYQVKRPEKVDRVEELIEQLEQATADWEEDESLLERAERRDWPIEYHKRYLASTLPNRLEPDKLHSVDRKPIAEAAEAEKRLSSEQRLDFGRRLDVPSIEEKSVARSHMQMKMNGEYHNYNNSNNNNSSYSTGRTTAELPERSPILSRRSINSMRPRSSYLPSAFADRYYDDLAVRRLRSKTINNQVDNRSTQTTMSYLLCSNAYTPSAATAADARDFNDADDLYDSLERRVRADDLQFRQYRAKNRLDPYEPPFGIPRQAATASVHSSASHYLRQQPPLPPHQAKSSQQSSLSQTNRVVCHCSTTQNDLRDPLSGHHHHNQTNLNPCEQTKIPTSSLSDTIGGGGGGGASCGERKRTDSRVSFVDDRAGGASADSGLAGGGCSPAFSEGTTPRSSRLATPITGNANYDDDAAEEIDLNDLWRPEDCFAVNEYHLLSDGDPKRCQSPAVELYTAQFRATPVRRRSRINFERPRAKSPLIKVSANKQTLPDESIAVGQHDSKVTTTKSKQVYNQGKVTTKQQQQQQQQRENSKPPVQIRTYEDSTKPTSEIECRYEFTDDDDDDEDCNVEGSIFQREHTNIDDEKLIRSTHKSKYITTTNLDNSSSSNEQSPNESSLERLNYRDGPSVNNKTNDAQPKTKNGPIFSIGPYKSLNKANLKIL